MCLCTHGTYPDGAQLSNEKCHQTVASQTHSCFCVTTITIRVVSGCRPVLITLQQQASVTWDTHTHVVGPVFSQRCDCSHFNRAPSVSWTWHAHKSNSDNASFSDGSLSHWQWLSIILMGVVSSKPHPLHSVKSFWQPTQVFVTCCIWGNFIWVESTLQVQIW